MVDAVYESVPEFMTRSDGDVQMDALRVPPHSIQAEQAVSLLVVPPQAHGDDRAAAAIKADIARRFADTARAEVGSVCDYGAKLRGRPFARGARPLS